MKKIGVLTSGGDAPGMNSAIRSVVRRALFNNVEVWGIHRGYQGLIERDIEAFTSVSVGGIIQRGGTILRTARSEAFRTPEGRKIAIDNLRNLEIDGLIVIGGDGSMRGAELLFEESGIPSVVIPATIDNDMVGTDYTIGFDTALNNILDAINKIRDTSESHQRVAVVEVMGRRSGQLAMMSALSRASWMAFSRATLRTAFVSFAEKSSELISLAPLLSAASMTLPVSLMSRTTTMTELLTV